MYKIIRIYFYHFNFIAFINDLIKIYLIYLSNVFWIIISANEL